MNRFLRTWRRRPESEHGQSAQDLLVTTSTALLRLTGQGSDATICHVVTQGQGLYYGLATDEQKAVWAAARRSRVSDALPSHEENGTLIKLSKEGVELTVDAPRPLRDLHGIAMRHGSIWLACSYDDAVAIYSPATHSWVWWRPLPTEPGAGPDQFHFNTLVFEQDLVWVLAHRRGPSWLLAFPIEAASRGLTVPPIHRIELGQQAHNIWRQPDGELCTCSSIEGVLLGENGWRLETGGFPRGVAQTSGGWVVGISELKERSERDFSDARLRFYNSDWEQAAQLLLPKVGMVLDIMPIPHSLALPYVGAQPLVAS